MADRGREHWAERSKVWAATSPPGRSDDDTFNQMIIHEAGIKPGEAVLDVASGTGHPAVSVALAMSGKGFVTSTDVTFGMLEAARKRARNLNLAIMKFTAADMAALPFADETFDCVTCRLGLMFAADRVGAAAQAKRVLKPGGRAAYMVWGSYDDNPRFHVPRRAVAAFFDEEEQIGADRHSLSQPGTVKGILDDAGFARTEERELGYKRRIDDADNYVASGLKRSFTKKVESMGEAEFDKLKRAVLAAWEPFMEDRILHVPNHARLGIGWTGA